MARMLYGSGLRLMECVRLRAQDLDCDYSTITARDGKGVKDRVTMQPQSLVVPFETICTTLDAPMRKTWLKTTEPSTCPTLWNANIPTPIASGSGSASFPSGVSRWIRAAAPSVATTSTKAVCGKLSGPAPLLAYSCPYEVLEQGVGVLEARLELRVELGAQHPWVVAKFGDLHQSAVG